MKEVYLHIMNITICIHDKLCPSKKWINSLWKWVISPQGSSFLLYGVTGLTRLFSGVCFAHVNTRMKLYHNSAHFKGRFDRRHSALTQNEIQKSLFEQSWRRKVLVCVNKWIMWLADRSICKSGSKVREISTRNREDC